MQGVTLLRDIRKFGGGTLISFSVHLLSSNILNSTMKALIYYTHVHVLGIIVNIQRVQVPSIIYLLP